MLGAHWSDLFDRQSLALIASRDERGDTGINVVARVRRADLHAYACLAHRHDWVGKRDDVDPKSEQRTRHAHGLVLVGEHDGNDRVFTGKERESRLRHLVAEALRVLGERLAGPTALGDEVECNE